MNPIRIMDRWTGFLQSHLKGTHQYQVAALAAFSLSAAHARHCHLSRLSAHVPNHRAIQPASTLRRLKRFLQNPRLDVEAICDEMASWLGRFNHSKCRICLLLDETPHHNDWRVAKVSVAYRRRALPLVWRTDALAGRPHYDRIMEVLHQSAELLARYCPKAQVVLLADRGLCWPDIMDFCLSQKWHFVLRAQSLTRFRPHFRCQSDSVPDSAPTHSLSLSELVHKAGQWWCGQGLAFAKAGWREVYVVSCWRWEAKEKWILVSDLPPSLHLTRWYAHRMWHEQSFRDEKSHGFSWQESHLKSAEAIHRLLLILALAQLWLTLLGMVALSTPWKEKLGLTSHQARARFSLFRHGWNFLLWCLNNTIAPPCHLKFKFR